MREPDKSGRFTYFRGTIGPVRAHLSQEKCVKIIDDFRIKEFKLVVMSSYSLEQGYRKWYEFQPQYNNEVININLENIKQEKNEQK